jgi:hypothetical protein
MHEYKKRLRLFVERHGAQIDYAHTGGLTLRTEAGTLDFTPDSKADMTCVVTTASGTTTFSSSKDLVFDIAHRFATGRSLDRYESTRAPLSLNEYVDEEHAESTVAELKRKIGEGTAKNGELGGNHYNAEYFNGILILFDIFTGAPTNVIDLG